VSLHKYSRPMGSMHIFLVSTMVTSNPDIF